MESDETKKECYLIFHNETNNCGDVIGIIHLNLTELQPFGNSMCQIVKTAI